MFGFGRRMSKIKLPELPSAITIPTIPNATNTWLISWCDLGLDTISNLNQNKKLKTKIVTYSFNIETVYSNDNYSLTNEDIIEWFKETARSNPDGNYEIWMIKIDAKKTAYEIEKMFYLSDFEAAKKMVRSKGVQIPY